MAILDYLINVNEWVCRIMLLRILTFKGYSTSLFELCVINLQFLVIIVVVITMRQDIVIRKLVRVRLLSLILAQFHIQRFDTIEILNLHHIRKSGRHKIIIRL